MSSAAQNRLGRFFRRVRNRFAPDTRIHTLKVRKMDKEDCCMICGDKAEETTTLIQPCRICMGYWCINCVRSQCQNASRTLGDMPPRCCREMDPRLILKHLDDNGDQKRYKELFHEYRTEVKDRVYCPNVQCGVLITQYTIKRQRLNCLINDESKAKKHDSGMPADNHITECPQCSTMICLTCKKDAHNGSPCQLDEDPAIAQLRKFGYKRCPRCGYGTRRMWGCSHMKCVCGAHWCWSCERNFAVCDALGGCDDYEEEDEDPEIDDEHAEHDEHAVEDANEAQNMNPVTTENGAEEKQTEDTNETGQNLDRRRSVNLDRGSHAFWEGEGLDFGDEPDSNDNEASWGCPHDFTTQANQADEFGKMLCWECWGSLDEGEESLKCWLCSLTRCNNCTELFKTA